MFEFETGYQTVDDFFPFLVQPGGMETAANMTHLSASD